MSDQSDIGRHLTQDEIDDWAPNREERLAIASLQRLAKRWPDTLGLFVFSGSLCVVRVDPDGGWLCNDRDQPVDVASIHIRSGGGDPG